MYSSSTTQLPFLGAMDADAPLYQPGNILSFNEVEERYRRKMEQKAYSIILNNIAHLKDKNEA